MVLAVVVWGRFGRLERGRGWMLNGIDRRQRRGGRKRDGEEVFVGAVVVGGGCWMGTGLREFGG